MQPSEGSGGGRRSGGESVIGSPAPSGRFRYSGRTADDNADGGADEEETSFFGVGNMSFGHTSALYVRGGGGGATAGSLASAVGGGLLSRRGSLRASGHLDPAGEVDAESLQAPLLSRLPQGAEGSPPSRSHAQCGPHGSPYSYHGSPGMPPDMRSRVSANFERKAKEGDAEQGDGCIGDTQLVGCNVARKAAGQAPLSKCLVIGTINALVGIPAQTAFATIVFQDGMYAPYLGALCKFFFFSSAIHQTVFLLMSTLPFAVGQVQDVGLIFLSSMASSIAAACETDGVGAATALGTTLLTFCISTFVVGLLTMLVGRFRLAQLVQYVPLPVVGGYLGYVGYFIVAGGTGLAAGIEINSVFDWARLLNADAFMRIVPMVATTLSLVTALERLHHPLVLPAMLVAIPVAFHVVLLASGVSLQQAQEAGWVMRPMEGASRPWELWALFNVRLDGGLDGLLGSFHWKALVSQLPKTVGLFMVVCFGSCMDVAAIQQDVPRPLDFNRELVTVGASNMVTAMVGAGYTGSYIFSQTIFTMRAGINNRSSSLMVAITEFAVFALPFSVVQYVPKFFFGGLLLWFGSEIVNDWLIASVRKLSRAEYVLLWMSFGVIMYFGLEEGILAGIALVTLYFAYEYSQRTVSAMAPVALSSGYRHDYSSQLVLDVVMPRRVLALTLQGYVFFGNCPTISERVEQAARTLVKRAEEEDACQIAEMEKENSLQSASSGPGSLARSSRNTDRRSKAGQVQLLRQLTLQKMTSAPLFLALDFSAVPAIDSTAARTFATLTNILAASGVQVIFSGLRKGSDIEALLVAHGIELAWYIGGSGDASRRDGNRRGGDGGDTPARDGDSSGGGRGGARDGDVSLGGGFGGSAALGSFDLSDDDAVGSALAAPGCKVWSFGGLALAARFVEEALLRTARAGGLVHAQAVMTLDDVVASHSNLPMFAAVDVAGAVGPHLEEITLSKGDVLYTEGAVVEDLYLVESGRMRTEPAAGSRWEGLCPAVEYGPGCFLSLVDLFTARHTRAPAVCFSTTATIRRLPRAKMRQLMNDAPMALSLLQVCMARSLAYDLASAQEQAEVSRSAAPYAHPRGT